jgi:excisionase family DNA binding protein
MREIPLNDDEVLLNTNLDELLDYDLMTRKEVAALFRISTPTVARYVKAGIIPAYMVGTRMRFKRSEVEKAFKPITTKQ